MWQPIIEHQNAGIWRLFESLCQSCNVLGRCCVLHAICWSSKWGLLCLNPKEMFVFVPLVLLTDSSVKAKMDIQEAGFWYLQILLTFPCDIHDTGEENIFSCLCVDSITKKTPANQVRLELKILKKPNPEVLDSCFPPWSKLPSSPEEVISSFRIIHLFYFLFFLSFFSYVSYTGGQISPI